MHTNIWTLLVKIIETISLSRSSEGSEQSEKWWGSQTASAFIRSPEEEQFIKETEHRGQKYKKKIGVCVVLEA